MNCDRNIGNPFVCNLRPLSGQSAYDRFITTAI
jgi:hypothetical protein